MNRARLIPVYAFLLLHALGSCPGFTAEIPEVEMAIKSTPTDWNITLVWTVPDAMKTFDVKVVRKEKSFPESVTDGSVVYTGTGKKAVDSNLVADTRYFYRFFFLDAGGNIMGWAKHREKT